MSTTRREHSTKNHDTFKTKMACACGVCTYIKRTGPRPLFARRGSRLGNKAKELKPADLVPCGRCGLRGHEIGDCDLRIERFMVKDRDTC